MRWVLDAQRTKQFARQRDLSPRLRALLPLRSASPPPLPRCVCLCSPAPVVFATRSGVLGAGLFSSFPFLSGLTTG